MKSITYIAGGSKGLGISLVEKFKANNHQVLEFSRSGQGENHIDCDFANPTKALSVFKDSFSVMQDQSVTDINLIINTAVLAPFGSLKDTDVESIEQHLNINIQSTMLLLHAYVKTFQQSQAHKSVAYISSGAARRDIPGLAMYSASKAFFERFMDTVATEQKSCEYPINCLVINPGVMDTGMQSQIRSQSEDDFPMVNTWQEWYENGQLASPDDIAAICFELTTKSGKNGGYYTAQDYLK